MTTEKAVETIGLTRRFGSFVAVDTMNLSVNRGQIYGFLGPNGSGKSTTIRMLCGILEPSEGEGNILGIDIRRNSEAVKTKIGYMSQKFSLYDDLTVQENLDFYAGMYSIKRGEKKERVREMMRMAGLEQRPNEMTVNLSGGWKQRLALGCAILHKPPVLFLDEPTGGVDPKSRRMFWDIIYRLAEDGTTVMVTTHFMDEAEHCDKIGFIFEGRLIADDTPHNLKMNMPGKLLEIPAEDPMMVVQKIHDGQYPHMDVYPYGAGVHVLVKEEDRHHYGGWKYQEIMPTLEDVFVHYVKNSRKEAAV